MLAHARASCTAAAEFGFGVLIRRGEVAVAHRIAAGLVDLDEVRAFLELLRGSRRTSSLGIVGVGGVGEHALFGIVVDGVFVAAQNIDGVAADAQARARESCLD